MKRIPSPSLTPNGSDWYQWEPTGDDEMADFESEFMTMQAKMAKTVLDALGTNKPDLLYVWYMSSRGQTAFDFFVVMDGRVESSVDLLSSKNLKRVLDKGKGIGAGIRPLCSRYGRQQPSEIRITIETSTMKLSPKYGYSTVKWRITPLERLEEWKENVNFQLLQAKKLVARKNGERPSSGSSRPSVTKSNRTRTDSATKRDKTSETPFSSNRSPITSVTSPKRVPSRVDTELSTARNDNSDGNAGSVSAPQGGLAAMWMPKPKPDMPTMLETNVDNGDKPVSTPSSNPFHRNNVQSAPEPGKIGTNGNVDTSTVSTGVSMPDVDDIESGDWMDSDKQPPSTGELGSVNTPNALSFTPDEAKQESVYSNLHTDDDENDSSLDFGDFLDDEDVNGMHPLTPLGQQSPTADDDAPATLDDISGMGAMLGGLPSLDDMGLPGANIGTPSTSSGDNTPSNDATLNGALSLGDDFTDGEYDLSSMSDDDGMSFDFDDSVMMDDGDDKPDNGQSSHQDDGFMTVPSFDDELSPIMSSSHKTGSNSSQPRNVESVTTNVDSTNGNNGTGKSTVADNGTNVPATADVSDGVTSAQASDRMNNGPKDNGANGSNDVGIRSDVGIESDEENDTSSFSVRSFGGSLGGVLGAENVIDGTPDDTIADAQDDTPSITQEEFLQMSAKVQMDMYALAVSILPNNVMDAVTHVYIYVSRTPSEGSVNADKLETHWDCFYRMGRSLNAAGDVLQRVAKPEEGRRFFANGRSLADDYVNLCRESGNDAPTEMKLTFDVDKGSLDASLSYDEIRTADDNGNPIDPYMEWAQDVYRSIQSEPEIVDSTVVSETDETVRDASSSSGTSRTEGQNDSNGSIDKHEEPVVPSSDNEDSIKVNDASTMMKDVPSGPDANDPNDVLSSYADSTSDSGINIDMNTSVDNPDTSAYIPVQDTPDRNGASYDLDRLEGNLVGNDTDMKTSDGTGHAGHHETDDVISTDAVVNGLHVDAIGTTDVSSDNDHAGDDYGVLSPDQDEDMDFVLGGNDDGGDNASDAVSSDANGSPVDAGIADKADHLRSGLGELSETLHHIISFMYSNNPNRTNYVKARSMLSDAVDGLDSSIEEYDDGQASADSEQ